MAQWYDHPRLKAMQTSVGLSDVATGGRLFITVTVLDSATKAIFQMTSGWQHTITCTVCCCQNGHHCQQQQQQQCRR